MSRPAFLDNPHALNVRSTESDPVRYASSVERAERSPWKSADLFAAVVLVALIAVMVWEKLP